MGEIHLSFPDAGCIVSDSRIWLAVGQYVGVQCARVRLQGDLRYVLCAQANDVKGSLCLFHWHRALLLGEKLAHVRRSVSVAIVDIAAPDYSILLELERTLNGHVTITDVLNELLVLRA